MSPLRPALFLALLLTAAGPAAAQDDPLAGLLGAGRVPARSFEDIADVKAEIVPAKAKPGQVVTFRLTVTPKPGCWTYPANPPAHQNSKNTIAWPSAGPLVFVGEAADPAGWHEKPSELTPGAKDRYYPDAATWERKAVVSPKAAPGAAAVVLTGTHLLACTADNCLPSSGPPSASLDVLAGPPEQVPAEFAAAVDTATGAKPPGPSPTKAADPAPSAAPTDESPTSTRGDAPPTSAVTKPGLVGLLTAAVFWGYVSLVTPCVFPMIPITVSLFLKQSNQSTGAAVRLALVYCLTIVAVLGLSAVFLLSVFQKLSRDPYTNVFLGGLFVVFALSLFGMYDLTLPNFLLRYSERRRAAGGMLGTVFGAVAFSIVSFTCVAPFLGGFAGLAATGGYNQVELTLAGLAFAAAFASPFFLLALFPSLLKKLPRSGGWLDTVKAVMGFLELAAALKFFRTAELVFVDKPQYFTYDACLAGFVTIAAACGLYLLNVFRLPHDEEKPSIAVPRLVAALGFLGFAVYLTPALFRGPDGQNQRPSGTVFAWVDAFLLPDATDVAPVPPATRAAADPGANGEPAAGPLVWKGNLMAEAKRISGELTEWEAKGRVGPPPAKRLIFVDFTGKTCPNCRLNEKNVFPRPDIESLFRRYTLVQQYTDVVPASLYAGPTDDATREADAEANLAYQNKTFGTAQLPLYVVLEPQANGELKTIGVYPEGKINNVPAFVEFLRKPLDAK